MIEIAWLVEFLSEGAGCQWWAGNGWTRDPLVAVRFSRRQDAEAVVNGLFPNTQGRIAATEHQWGF